MNTEIMKMIIKTITLIAISLNRNE